MEKILPPGVQDGEESDLYPQTFGIGSDGGQGFGRGSEQNAVDEIFVLVSNGRDLFGDREDNVEIVCRENFGLSFFDPRCTSKRLALWTVAVTAAVVAGPLVMTAVAPFEMAAEGGSATHLDRGHDTPLCRR